MQIRIVSVQSSVAHCYHDPGHPAEYQVEERVEHETQQGQHLVVISTQLGLVIN